MAEACLVDTNVLVRCMVPADPLAPVAREAVRRMGLEGDSLCLATQNLVELWAVATRPVTANGLGLAVSQAAEELRRLQSLMAVVHEKPDTFALWFDLASRVGVAGRQAHDARLAAVMLTNSISRILTFNTYDFVRFPGVTVIHPRDAVARR